MTDFFTYSGPSVSATFTTGIFNNSWNLALQQVQAVTDITTTAQALATNPPTIPVDGVNQSLTLPVPPSVPPYDPNQIDAEFTAQMNAVEAYLSSQFTSFLGTYFPTSEYLTYAQTWLDDVFTVGGTGFAPGIEDQIWQRERSRLMADAARGQDEALATWANRGYPLPPGAANESLIVIQQGLQGQVAESSRTRAIENAKIEIENLRFAVTSAIDLRMKGIAAAGDFLRAMALGPQVGSQVAVANAETQARMTNALTELYRANVVASELPVRLRITDAELKERANESNLTASVQSIHDKVQAALGAASALGSIAASAINSLHGSSGLSGSESL